MATAFLVEMLTCNAFKVNVRGELVLNRRGMIEACPDTGFDGLRGAVLSQRAGDARAAWTDEAPARGDHYLVAYRSRSGRVTVSASRKLLADATADDETHWSVTLLPALPEFAVAADESTTRSRRPSRPSRRRTSALAAGGHARGRARARRQGRRRAPRRVLPVRGAHGGGVVDVVRRAQEKARPRSRSSSASSRWRRRRDAVYAAKYAAASPGAGRDPVGARRPRRASRGRGRRAIASAPIAPWRTLRSGDRSKMTFRTLGSNGSLTTAPCSERRESKRKRAKSSVERHLHRQWHIERQRYRIAQRTSVATAGRVRCAMRLRDTTFVRVAARCARLLRVSSSSTRVRTSCEKINRCCSGDPAVGEAIRMRRDSLAVDRV